MSNQYAVLKSPLIGFEAPDTTAQSSGQVGAGKYLVEELRLNYPDQDTDYALISVPYLGDEDTWVCSRWKTNNYADIIEQTPEETEPIVFDDDPNAINESQLVELLPHFYDFTYDLDRGRYPFPLPGFKAPLSPPGPKTNNCCTFVEALVVKAWENAGTEGFEWGMERHKQMMIFSADDYFSPVTALVQTEMAQKTPDDDQQPLPWTVIQGWRKQWTSGHTFIILDHHKDTDKVLTLESNSSYKLDGVGYRMIGNIGEFNTPPSNWWEIDNLWTWERVKSVYRFRKQCALRIKDRSWVPT